MAMVSTMSPAVQVLSPPTSPTVVRRISLAGSSSPAKSHFLDLERFSRNAEEQLARALTPETLQLLSAQLQQRFGQACRSSPLCYLPSFCHTLPSGYERGAALALDVGGSNMRVALVELCGRGSGSGAPFAERVRRDFPIDARARDLSGRAFFAWMADRVLETFQDQLEWVQSTSTLPIGLSWSFPVEQKSIRNGLLMQMGKGLRATDGLIGENLADLVTDACKLKGLNVDVQAIVNDSSSSLLSGAYELMSSPISLILGTGLNASVHLPVEALDSSKYGNRPEAWNKAAESVVVNTELSLFGRNVFPLTRWDKQLKAAHSDPDFQPLEHLTSGRYLGEVVRLVLADAIQEAALFGGATPANFQPYQLTTETVGMVEADNCPSRVPLVRAAAVMEARHPLPNGRAYSIADIRQVHKIVKFVSTRATAFLAASVHAVIAHRDQFQGAARSEDSSQDLVIGCNGSVLEKYPDFLGRVQRWLDLLLGDNHQKVRLQLTGESAMLGAAVAVVCQHE